MSTNGDLMLLSDLPNEVEKFANLGVWHYDLHENVITWSSNLFRIYELKKEDFTGSYEFYRKLLHPDDRAEVERVIEKAIKDKTTFSFDKRIITGKGNTKHIRTWGMIVLNDDDEPMRITGLSMDISETMESEKALKESEALNRKLVEYTPNAIVIQNPEGEILYANQIAADLIKAPSVEYLIGLNSAQFRDPEDESMVQTRIGYVMSSGEVAPKLELTYTCIDGTRKVGESVIIPFEYKHKPAILSVINDITSQKRALKAVKDSESQLRYFVQNTPVAVAMLDKHMNYIACSEKYLEDWWVKDNSLTIENIAGINHYELFPDVRNDWKKVHQRVLEGETLGEESDSFVKANGKKEWIRWKNQPWYNSDGEVGGIILFSEFITERKEAEEKVQNSRNRLDTLIQNLPGLVYSCRPDNYSLTFVSSGSIKITGYKPEDFFGKDKVTFEQIAHPDDLPKIRAIMERSIANKEPFEISYRIFTKGGEIRYLSERGQALFAKSGNPISIEGVALDISERMEAEKALRKSKESLDAAQRVSHLGSWEWNLGSGEITWSDEYFRICGEEPGAFEPTMEIFESYIHQDDLKDVKKAITETVKSAEPYKLDKRIVRKDGTIRFVQSQGEALLSETGKPNKIIGSIQDITDRKLTEKALEESRNRNVAIINALPDLMFITTLDGTYLDYQVSNPTFLTDINKSQPFVGQNVRDFLGKESAEEFIEKSYQAEATETVQTLEYTLSWNSKTRHYEARIVKYEEGKVLSMIRDITKSKENEAQLVQLTEELTTSNAELKQFAYITSHDLRAPVVNIDTLLKLYTDDRISDEDRKEVLQKITNSAEQLKSTLNDLIQLVAIKDGKEKALTSIRFEDVVKAVVSNLDTQIKSEDAKIETDFSEAQSIVSQRATVYSILQNLISNALKYRSERQPVIKISSTIRNEYICLSVEDNGVGIDMKRFGSKLFGMYQRFHENKEGKGLGLYIIKSQIESLGGFIEVNSDVGRGSTFNICFKNSTND